LEKNLKGSASTDPQTVKSAVGQLLLQNGGLVEVAHRANICKSVLSRWQSPLAKMRLKSFVPPRHWRECFPSILDMRIDAEKKRAVQAAPAIYTAEVSGRPPKS
jgi:hypothetical protein